MRLPNFLRRFVSYGRDPFRRYEDGMTLGPGESSTATFDIQSIFPPDVAAAIQAGEKSLNFREEGQIKIGPDRYKKSVTVLLDNKPYGLFSIEFTGAEGSDLSVNMSNYPRGRKLD